MYMAIDIGGTKTLIAVFGDEGQIIEQIKFLTPSDYTRFKDDLSDNVAKLSTKNFSTVVVAVPGRINRDTGKALAFGNLEWVNIPLEADISEILNSDNIRIENDAKLAALSEAILINDRFNKVLYLTISTGIGGGLVIDGRIDPNTKDMEPGQMLLEYEGRLKSWEDFASGKAFGNKFNMLVGDTPEDRNDAWYWLSRNIAIGLISLVANLNPDVIVIGGGAGAFLSRFKDRLDEQIKIYESPMFSTPPILEAKRPNEAVVYGCYELAKQHENTTSSS
ncbi:ROK family protein [Candidatus Saccharibacteria bacterium]|nr:ROK family protein [Candidatus Saccharibacteria bacterium]